VTLKSAGFLFLMKYGKPPLLYEDQLTMLIGRGLVCPDRPRALQWLQRIGYYRLSAYFIPFRHPDSDAFKNGTSLDAIVDLYKFDGGLRLLTLQAIDRIEIGIRAAITYQLAHGLGVFGYADAANFAKGYDHAGLMRNLRNEEGKTSEAFVKHYRSKYTAEPVLPVWMATELLSFGALSKMYANLRTSLRKTIAATFGQPEPVFTSWVHALVATRNTCAHHSRIWNRELAIKPTLPQAWPAAGIDNHRFYAIALVIQTLLESISPNSKWKDRLKAHFTAYPRIDLAAMHFPADWQGKAPWA
jgi:abortive infection bacteriophage resistance protein